MEINALAEVSNPWIVKDYSWVANLLEFHLISKIEQGTYQEDYLLKKSDFVPSRLVKIPHDLRISSNNAHDYLNNNLNIAD